MRPKSALVICKPYLNRELTVVAYLWARTVKSPNPAFAHVEVPLVSTFMLSNKAGKEVYIQPVIAGGGYRFTVKMGKPKDAHAAKNGTKLARANFFCLMSNSPISGEYIKAQGYAGHMGSRLLAIVADGGRGRVYLSPTDAMEAPAHLASPEWKPDVVISGSTQYLGVKPYGMERFAQLFTDRKLVALTTFANLLQEVRERVKQHASDAGLSEDDRSLSAGGKGATACADAVAVYLAIAISRLADYGSSLAT
jgi:putative DNA methylase